MSVMGFQKSLDGGWVGFLFFQLCKPLIHEAHSPNDQYTSFHRQRRHIAAGGV